MTKLIEQNHTSTYLKTLIDDTLDDFKIKHKTEFSIHDNASNMALISTLSGFTDIRCFDHNWDLALKCAAKLPSLEVIIAKARKLVGHFNHSPNAQILLKNAQRSLGISQIKLKQFCETRWGSMFAMFETIYKNKLSIEKVLDDTEASDDFKFTINEWKIIKSIVPILKAITAVYSLMTGESYSTLSLVYPTVMRFNNEILATNDYDLKEICDFKSLCKEKLKQRFKFDQISISTTPGILCCVLDPNFKDLSFINNNIIKKAAYSEIKNQMKTLHQKSIETRDDNSDTDIDMETITPSTSHESAIDIIFGKHDISTKEISFTEEFKSYINVGHNRGTDLLLWWKENEKKFPLLSVLAKKYLSIPSTSVTSERMFSKAGFLVSKRRSLLSPKSINEVLFLNKNMSYFK